MLKRPVLMSKESRVGVGESTDSRFYDNINVCGANYVFDPLTQKCYPKKVGPKKHDTSGQSSSNSTTTSGNATNRYRGLSDLSKSGIKDPNRFQVGGFVPRLNGLEGNSGEDNSTSSDQTQDPSFVNGCTSQGMFTFPGVDRCLTLQDLQDLLQKQADCARTPGSTFDPVTLTCKTPEAPQPKLCSDGLPEDPTTGCQRTEPKTEDKAEEKKSSTGMILVGVGALALLGGGLLWMSKNSEAARSSNPQPLFHGYDYDIIKRNVIDANMSVDTASRTSARWPRCSPSRSRPRSRPG